LLPKKRNRIGLTLFNLPLHTHAMAGPTNKIIVFLFGITLGLLIGAGVFILRIDEYIGKLELFKSSKDTITIVKEEKLPDTKKKKNITNYSGKKSKSQNDSVNFSQETDSLTLGGDTTSLLTTLRRDSLDDQIVVKKDEIITSSSMNVINLGTQSKPTGKDSTLESISGIKDDGKNQVNKFTVEFWRSPINYRGYKMSKNKIILFGMNPDENMRLYRVDENIYIRQSSALYKIDYTNEFRGLERVSDPQLLAKTN
jgi:hypothetical protein